MHIRSVEVICHALKQHLIAEPKQTNTINMSGVIQVFGIILISVKYAGIGI